MRIILCYPVEPKHLAQIAAAAPPDAEIVDAGQEHVAEQLFTADIFCGHAKVPVDWDGVVAQKRLLWVQSSAAGMDHCLVPAVIDADIAVTSASGVLSDQVGEHTLALVTAWTRALPVFLRAQHKREFIRRPTRDLTGSTVGIIGFGGNGRRLAEMLAPFRCRLLVTDMFPVDKPPYVDALLPADALNDVAAEVDFLMLNLPLNDSTRGFVDARLFGRMKRGSVLVNMARGAIVNHDDLVAALTDGHLAGAVMDVTEPEPLHAESPLWDMPQVIITPHVGGQAAWRIDKMTDLFCRNLRRWQHGQPLINYLIDKRLGFPVRGRGYPAYGDAD
jgi:D-3-phosphoglycerate dehydrogenase